MYLIGVLLYRTNNPAILRSEYIVRPVQRLQLNQYYCPICNCPTSQNIRLSRDADLDVSLDDYL